MPVEFLAQTTNDYSDALTLGGPGVGQQFTSVLFAVSAPYSAKFQVAKKRNDGTVYWDGNDITAQPGQGGYTACYGIRFKSFDGANATTVLAVGYFLDDPVPAGNISSLSSFGTNGVITNNSMILGFINADGTVNRGSGFTVLKTATGRYTITFSDPFTNPPVVVATANNDGIIVAANGAEATGVLIATDNSSGVATDNSFGFIASAIG